MTRPRRAERDAASRRELASAGGPESGPARPEDRGRREWPAAAALGGIVWLGLAALALAHRHVGLSSLDLILALGVLLVVPLAAAVTATPRRDGAHGRPYRALALALPAASLLAAASLVTAPGLLAAVLVAPWVGATCAGAAFGLWRLLPRGIGPPEEAAIDAGWLYLPVGGAWLLAARAGWEPLGFRGIVVELTAAHFHYIPVALIAAGLVGRALTAPASSGPVAGAPAPGARPAGTGPSTRIHRLAVATVLPAPALVAVGIALDPAVEAVGGTLLGAGMATVALVGLWASRNVEPRGARWLLRLSFLALAFAMALAVLYALRPLVGPTFGIEAMVVRHGWVNAVAFALAGMAGWWWAHVPARTPAPGIPFSRLRARGRVGGDFFERRGLVTRPAATDGRAGGPAAERSAGPAGMVDDVEEYRGEGFDPDRLPPAVRAFYERTAEHGLVVAPAWRRGLGGPARAYGILARRLEQMNLPVDAGGAAGRLESAILPISEAADGRRGVRAWVRTYRGSGRALYAAAYARHAYHGRAYMNIAFPFPGGNVSSILRVELEEGEPGPSGSPALVLTTRPPASGPGDEGIYFVARLAAVRLPLDETIRVCEAGRQDFDLPAGLEAPPATTVVARHDMWACGVRTVTLYYAIFPLGGR